jgi:hypothetical protein
VLGVGDGCVLGVGDGRSVGVGDGRALGVDLRGVLGAMDGCRLGVAVATVAVEVAGRDTATMGGAGVGGAVAAKIENNWYALKL